MSRLKRLWADGDIDTYRRIFVITALRRVSYRWPARTEAMGEARIKRGVYRCTECAGQFGRRDVQMDHIEPVIEPVAGFRDWNTFVERLLCARTGYQTLCKLCHAAKSKHENVQRRRSRPVRRRSGAK